jgi:S1-C subfamily serine protease
MLRSRLYFNYSKNSFPVSTIFACLLLYGLFQYGTPADFIRLVVGNPFSSEKLLKKKTVGGQKLTPDEIYAKLVESTVRIEAADRGIGTGIIVREDGLVLTNDHVIRAGLRYNQVSVTLKNGTRYAGTVIGNEPSYDLALLKLEDAKELKAVTWADYPKDTPNNYQKELALVNSEPVYAIGFPNSKPWRMTSGELYGVSGESAPMDWKTPFWIFISKPGLLFPGDSGGPLINSYGQVVGINHARYGRDGSGASISLETVKGFLDEILPNVHQDELQYRGRYSRHRRYNRYP